jgi:malonate-semialdehyde dehydrogenase (acetylating)/methylmalonate-semialdehyde dehydrogenase
MESNGVLKVDNFIGGNFVLPTSGRYLDVLDPAIPGKVIAKCGISTENDVGIAVEAAKKALHAWSQMTIKARAAVMMKFHSIVQREADELAKMIVLENGKNMTEALAEGA